MVPELTSEDREKADKALKRLLLNIFGAGELRRFARFGPHGDRIAKELPDIIASASQIAESYINLVQGEGLLDTRFFDLLVEERPRRADEIWAVAELFKIRRAAQEDTAGNVLEFKTKTG